LLYVTHCALSVEEPKSLAFNVSGVVNTAFGKTPIGDAVEVGTEEIPGTVKVFPGNAEPSTIVPLAFSMALQIMIEPSFVGAAFGWTVIETLEELFERFESVVDAFSVTVAVFVIVVLAVPESTSAAMSNVAVELAERLPIVHVPVELAYEPSVEVAETKLTPEGKTSVAVTPVEVAGPLALTFNV
jgi:hypothetical protein